MLKLPNSSNHSILIGETLGVCSDGIFLETANPANLPSTKARPEIKAYPDNFEDYDTIFVGYPNWWGTMPMCMFTLLEKYEPDREKLTALAEARLRGKPIDRRELKRTADALFRRGFSWSEIQDVLREFEMQAEEIYED